MTLTIDVEADLIDFIDTQKDNLDVKETVFTSVLLNAVRNQPRIRTMVSAFIRYEVEKYGGTEIFA